MVHCVLCLRAHRTLLCICECVCVNSELGNCHSMVCLPKFAGNKHLCTGIGMFLLCIMDFSWKEPGNLFSVLFIVYSVIINSSEMFFVHNIMNVLYKYTYFCWFLFFFYFY